MSEAAGREFLRLIEIMQRLRGPEGCPWDREQSPRSLRRSFLEEAHELLEAIDEGDEPHTCEELGDLCLHVVFQACMAEERGAFTMADSLRTVNEKLVRRHPHVFAEARVRDAGQVVENWDQIKAEERRERGESRESALDGVPRGMPALLHAEKLQRQAAKVGFDWSDAAGPLAKVAEEARELSVGGGGAGEREDEFGDLLFSLVNLGRHLGVNPEAALLRASRKFERRFRAVEALAAAEGRPLAAMQLAEMDALWDRVKAEEAPCDSTSS